ncbi:MAG: hypothetical protein JWM87_730 [Candidatus Eremiobacteraeota bacterium]|nr:hypothetical protein [Candidatus Eremiobacteraeota bacterium]
MPEINDLSVKGMDELTFVFTEFGGQKWQQRNQDAITLITKGGPEADTAKSKSFLGDLWSKVAGKAAPAEATAAAPAATTKADAEGGDLATTIAENAADWAARSMSWDALSALICQLNCDLSMVFQSGDAFTDDEKKIAAQRCIEAFGAAAYKLLPMLLGNVEIGLVDDVSKAGARHSKKDAERIKKIGEHAGAINDLHGQLMDAEDAKDGASDEATEKGATAQPDAVAATIAPSTAPPAETVASKADAAQPPAQQPPAEPALAAMLKATLDAFTATLQQSVTTQLETHAKAFDDRFVALDDKIAKATAAKPEPSPLQASVAAIKAAQLPTAPAGAPALTTTGEYKAGALIELPPVQHDGSIRGILKAKREQQA